MRIMWPQFDRAGRAALDEALGRIGNIKGRPMAPMTAESRCRIRMPFFTPCGLQSVSLNPKRNRITIVE